jgi:hypothetical protein
MVVTIGGILLMILGIGLVVGGMLGLWLIDGIRNRIWRRSNRGPRDPFR